MRRRKKEIEKVRVKILEAKRAGLTYEEIKKKTGASSRTIANLVKGKDLSRFCTSCGETDAQKLEEHHPDKANRPNQTVTLCANCHATVTSEQQRKRNSEKKIDLAAPKSNPTISVPTPPKTINQTQMSSPQLKPFTPIEKRWIARGVFYGSAGIAIGEGLLDRKLPGWARLMLIITGGVLLYTGSKTK